MLNLFLIRLITLSITIALTRKIPVRVARLSLDCLEMLSSFSNLLADRRIISEIEFPIGSSAPSVMDSPAVPVSRVQETDRLKYLEFLLGGNRTILIRF